MSESEGLHHYKFLYQRFLASTLGWPEDAQMGYVKLLTVQFERGGIPDNIKEVGLISPAARKHWRRIKPKFPHVNKDGLLYNWVMDVIRLEAIASYTASVENGKKGGRPKKPDPKPTGYPRNNPALNPALNLQGNPTRTSNEEPGNTTPELSESVSPPARDRKPRVPTFDQVHQVFIQNGGTEEMAKKFFDSRESTGWYYQNSAITNFVTQVPSFISAWRQKDGKPESEKNWMTRL